MSAPLVVAVAPGSPAALAGLQPGDEIARVDGQVPRDVIEWQMFTDEADLVLDVRREAASSSTSRCRSGPANHSAIEVQSAVFDRVRTCDNHCEFCFIYQLPKGMRRSLYLKDDDYRLSFLYGNFTTLTRFTEADLERVVTERLSPLHVSIHATDHDVRNRMLKNQRGGDEPAVAAGAARPRHRGHGPDRRVPRRQRRRRARRHARRRARPIPRARVGGGRAARVVEVQHRVGDAAAHRRRGRSGRRRGRVVAGRSSSTCSVVGWCSPPTSTT